MILIDLLLLIDLLIPPVQREDWLVDYIRSSFKPLINLQNDFYSFRDDIKYQLTFNGQVIYMEHVLNDQFDPVNRGIYITDSTLIQNTYIFTNAEDNETTYIVTNAETAPPVYLYTNQEYIDDVDFIVNIPSTVTYNEDEVKFWVNKYRIAPMRWKIEII